jgi:hypothetical protein
MWREGEPETREPYPTNGDARGGSVPSWKPEASTSVKWYDHFVFDFLTGA